jgi:exopolysaccharide biosynthesis polyprenyl glycosylphosphotransferase
VGVLLAAERLLVLRLLRFWRGQGKNFRNIIICGVGEQAQRLAGEIAARPELGIRVRGFADLHPLEYAPERHRDLRAALVALGIPRSGRIIVGCEELGRALKEYAVDEVIFTDVATVMAEVEEMVLVCSEQGVRTTIAADLFSLGMVKSGLSYFGGMPLIHFQTPPGDRWELTVKRWLDIGVSGALLIALLPIFGAVALAVRLSSPGPILFHQRRMGLNGRIFVMYKFRSMFVDAEDRLHELRDRNEMAGPVFKLKDDPRVTPAGRVLRRFSLDELPQLWNVFIGDMSLVGPRPPIPGEVSLYERRDRRRLSMRPGITCTWQVSGRNDIKDFESWVKLDLEYIDNWSLGRDMVLLARTIPAVLFGVGAR